MTKPLLVRSLLSITALAVLASCGLADGKPQPRTAVVLVDTSGSIDQRDRLIYQESVAALAAELGSGDRLLIAAVGDLGRSDFRAVLDIRLPQTDIRVDRENAVRSARAAVMNTLPRLFETAPQAPRTRLVEGVAGAVEAFGSPPYDGHLLLLLSDGVEDSAFGNLDGPRDESEAMVARMRSAGLLPDLRGLSITVVGAGGAHYDRVRHFWEKFAGATGASIADYGRLPYRGQDVRVSHD